VVSKITIQRINETKSRFFKKKKQKQKAKNTKIGKALANLSKIRKQKTQISKIGNK
jgi:hypothetical protein